MRFFFFFIFLSSRLVAQIPFAGFNAPASACLDENILLTNTSTNATTYLWDICQGDLTLPPTVKSLLNLGANVTQGIDIVYNGSEWFGFVANQNGNSIIRIDFGAELTNDSPTIVNLGNFNDAVAFPIDIKIIKDGDNWYGFVYNLSNNILSRINFGTDLKNTSAQGVTGVSLKSGSGSNNSGLDVIKEGNSWKLLYTNNNSIFVVNLHTITSIPQSGDFFLGIEIPGTLLGDIVALQHNSNYYAYTVSHANQTLQGIDFGNSITNIATTQNLGVAFNGLTPFGIDYGLDNGDYVLFVSTIQGSLIRINIGEQPFVSSIQTTNLTNFSTLGNTLKINVVKEKSRWHAFTPSWSSSQLFRVDFPSPTCTTETLSSQNPVLKFTTSGKKGISLTASNNGLNPSEKSLVINIENKNAPTLSWQNIGVCKDNPINFQTTAPAALSYEWKSNGTTFSNLANPTFVYAQTGTYHLELSISDGLGCNNYLAKDITIYNQPIAAFEIPNQLICTNNLYTISAQTPDNFDGFLSYSWQLNGTEISTQRDVNFTFNNTTDADLYLQTSIPGCSNSLTKSIQGIEQGPIVDFTITNACQNQNILFNNLSPNASNNFNWSFGNGLTSTEVNTQTIYTTPGTYEIELSSTAINNCVTKKKVSHTIYATPTVNFMAELPPFSCSGTPTQFTDLTPNPTDSNLQSWLWTFAPGQISTTKNPTFTYQNAGLVSVSLSVTTNRGCNNSLTKNITIAQSPNPSITNNPACLNQATLFNANVGNATEWFWQIGNSFYFVDQPVHVFSNTGNVNASVVVTANNGCVSTIQKAITIPVPMVTNFTAIKTCAGLPGEFSATATLGSDPIIQYEWNFENEIVTGQNVTKVFNTTGTKVVTVNAIGESGCKYEASKAIQVIASPIPSFTANPERGRPPLAVQFTNTSQLATSYVWRFNDANNTTSESTSPSFIFDQLGEYPVDLIAINEAGCEATLTKIIQVLIPRLSVSISDFELVQNQDGTYSANVIVKNDGNLPADNVSIALKSDSGLRLILPIGTVAMGDAQNFPLSASILPSEKTEYVCAEIVLLENEAASNLDACDLLGFPVTAPAPYPNPAKQKLIQDFIVEEGERKVDITVFNSLGKEVYQISQTAISGLNRVEINTENWAAGLYTIKIESNQYQKTFKVAVRK